MAQVFQHTNFVGSLSNHSFVNHNLLYQGEAVSRFHFTVQQVHEGSFATSEASCLSDAEHFNFSNFGVQFERDGAVGDQSFGGSHDIIPHNVVGSFHFSFGGVLPPYVNYNSASLLKSKVFFNNF